MENPKAFSEPADKFREDRQLADIVKTTHSHLRKMIQSIEVEGSIDNDNLVSRREIEDNIWADHADSMLSVKVQSSASPICSADTQSYSQAMKTLANKHWTASADKNIETSNSSRILWLKRHIDMYFKSDRSRFIRRLERRLHCEKLQASNSCGELFSDGENTQEPGPLQILDVGSCYNPLAHEYEKQDVYVTAIDLCPTADSVLKCDFVRVPIIPNQKSRYVLSEHNKDGYRTVSSFSETCFDVVIFCLFLEYLPSPRLRSNACQKAKQLLKTNGLLLIVTPDSSRNHAKNEKQMKSWRLALAKMGLLRIYIEKLRHLRCMGYVKIDKSKYEKVCEQEIANVTRKLLKEEPLEKTLHYANPENVEIDTDLLFIPQDRTTQQLLENERKSGVLAEPSHVINHTVSSLEKDILRDFSGW